MAASEWAGAGGPRGARPRFAVGAARGPRPPPDAGRASAVRVVNISGPSQPRAASEATSKASSGRMGRGPGFRAAGRAGECGVLPPRPGRCRDAGSGLGRAGPRTKPGPGGGASAGGAEGGWGPARRTARPSRAALGPESPRVLGLVSVRSDQTPPPPWCWERCTFVYGNPKRRPGARAKLLRGTRNSTRSEILH